MKLSQVRGCDNCGGKIAPIFYVVRVSIAVFNAQKTNQVLGMTQFFQGSLVLGEMFSGDDDVVTVAMDDDEHKGLMTELLLCQDCYMKPLNLAVLAERQSENIKST